MAGGSGVQGHTSSSYITSWSLGYRRPCPEAKRVVGIHQLFSESKGLSWIKEWEKTTISNETIYTDILQMEWRR